jgi:hypothetical protein
MIVLTNFDPETAHTSADIFLGSEAEERARSVAKVYEKQGKYCHIIRGEVLYRTEEEDKPE